MKTTCLISSHNYVKFVGEAIEGALRQSTPFDEIIVVDDGSTDGSLELLENAYAGHPTVQVVAKPNEGQLSCFNEGFAHATGDIVFFLDADDIYDPGYVERALQEYRSYSKCGFLFCGCRFFGDREGVSLRFPESRDLGYSVIRTTYSKAWIGGVTSTLSLRRSVLEEILPLPFVDDWRTRADDCLVFGASLVGARKRFLAEPLVRYRVHARNHFYGSKPDATANYRRRLAVNRLFEHLQRQQCYNVEQLADFPHREFKTIESPSFDVLREYARICMRARTSMLRRISCVLSMTHHYFSTSRRTHPALGHETMPAANGSFSPRLFSPDTIAQPESSSEQPLQEGRKAA